MNDVNGCRGPRNNTDTESRHLLPHVSSPLLEIAKQADKLEHHDASCDCVAGPNHTCDSMTCVNISGEKPSFSPLNTNLDNNYNVRIIILVKLAILLFYFF